MIPRTWIPNCILGLLMPERPIPVAARLLRLQVWILLEAWMSVSCECSVLSGRDLCDGPITSHEESYWVWCVWSGDYVRLLHTLLNQRVQSPASGRAESKLVMPITRRNKKAGQSASSTLVHHLTSHRGTEEF